MGGAAERALRRVGELGDGWLANPITDPAIAQRCRDKISRYAEAAGRDPEAIGYQQMLAGPPRDNAGKAFYADSDQVVRRAVEIADMGFEWAAVNATAIFQSGARSVDAMLDVLATLRTTRSGKPPAPDGDGSASHNDDSVTNIASRMPGTSRIP